ncbi:MAG: hypothetical protein J0L63_11405 [Anaerolineae bacterium]|nr:hypothetical protein [Anaerolineae bacterium]MBN8619505.1 hypothetical protein [Anaerolineae bacterium]
MIVTEWADDSKRVICIHFTSPFTREEYEQMNAQKVQMMKTVTHPVALILDVSRTRTVPTDLFMEFRRSAQWVIETEQLEQVVLAHSSVFIRSLLLMMVEMYPQISHKLKLAKSVEEARELLQKKYTAIQNTPSS